MKKVYLKRWVEVVLIIIQFLLVMIMAGDCDNLKVFIISKVIALFIFVIIHIIMTKYSRLMGDSNEF